MRRLGVLNVKDPRAFGCTYNRICSSPTSGGAPACSWRSSRMSVEQPPAPKKKGKKKEPVVVVPPKDPTPGTAFLRDLVFRVRKRPTRAGLGLAQGAARDQG